MQRRAGRAEKQTRELTSSGPRTVIFRGSVRHLSGGRVRLDEAGSRSATNRASCGTPASAVSAQAGPQVADADGDDQDAHESADDRIGEPASSNFSSAWRPQANRWNQWPDRCPRSRRRASPRTHQARNRQGPGAHLPSAELTVPGELAADRVGDGDGQAVKHPGSTQPENQSGVERGPAKPVKTCRRSCSASAAVSRPQR